MIQVFVGVEAPESLNLSVKSLEVDLRNVESVTVRVKHPDESFTDWNATISFQNKEALRAKHIYTPGGEDIPSQGRYVSVVMLHMTGGGVMPCQPRLMEAVDRYRK